MPLYLDTRGRGIVAIGICARCSLKFPLEELYPDVNYPGLLCCVDDLDDIDPYRLPPRETESITLDMPRPDVPLIIPPDTVPPVGPVAGPPGAPTGVTVTQATATVPGQPTGITVT